VHDQHKEPKSDIQIAQESHLLPIAQVAHRRLGVNLSDLLLYGHFKAKVSLDYLNTLERRPNSKLILVTAMTPTAAAKGKPQPPSVSATR
jgi:formate--tetrahydrofolate ligase